ncbi:MAG: long-chain fatty acid--CoA ligase [Alphaproteobacteria bacterium]|nr:long-chain fatty acid--CoA ligase [Alphaproteobacteria bacterium]
MPEKDFPWLKTYPRSVNWEYTKKPEPLYIFLENTASKYPARAAVDHMGKKYDWQTLWDEVLCLAKGLQEIGVKKGDHIGLFLPNSPYYVISYYAVLLCGACVVNLNPLYAEQELKHLIEDSGAEIIISVDLEMLYYKMHQMLRETRLKKLVICSFVKSLPFPKNILFRTFKAKDLAQVKPEERILWYDTLTAKGNNPVRPPIDPHNDLAVIQYTGGTTGTPKGAMLTHENLYANTLQCLSWFYEIDDHPAKMMGVLPFFHVFAMTAVLNFSVAHGIEIITLPRFDLKETLKIIHKKKPQFFPAVPAIYSAINHCPTREKYDLSSLRYCLSGGAPLPVEVKKTFEEKTGCVLIEGYGLSESSPVATVNPVRGENRAGSIGLPLPGTIIEIIDPQDKKTLMPIGERGELCIRGPQVMKGYWNKPEATADVLRPTGEGDLRLYTGDIAIMDKDGYIYIVDRLKDMIITNGYNVYPRNVEEAVYKHPNVEECIVAGLPDEKRGEIVKIWLKLKEGRTLTPDDLKEFLKDKISPMEIPKLYEFRDQPLPKTMIGKLSRKDVLAQELEKK